MNIIRTLVVLAAVAPSAAIAGEKFDIPYFVAHPGERTATLQMCHNDYRYAVTLICENAEAAATRVWGATSGRENLNPLTTTRYWVENPIARKSVLAQCARRAPGDEMQFRWCGIAGRADTMASK